MNSEAVIGLANYEIVSTSTAVGRCGFPRDIAHGGMSGLLRRGTAQQGSLPANGAARELGNAARFSDLRSA